MHKLKTQNKNCIYKIKRDSSLCSLKIENYFISHAYVCKCSSHTQYKWCGCVCGATCDTHMFACVKYAWYRCVSTHMGSNTLFILHTFSLMFELSCIHTCDLYADFTPQCDFIVIVKEEKQCKWNWNGCTLFAIY